MQSVPAYVSINPALFESSEHWSYRDLQRLAKRINIPAAGRREQLVERLVCWHRAQRSSDQPGKFHSVEVRASPAGKPISPRLMSPLVQRNEGTNGILAVGGSNTPREDVEPRSPLVPRSSSKQNSVVFSPVRQAHDRTTSSQYMRALHHSVAVTAQRYTARQVKPLPGHYSVPQRHCMRCLRTCHAARRARGSSCTHEPSLVRTY